MVSKDKSINLKKYWWNWNDCFIKTIIYYKQKKKRNQQKRSGLKINMIILKWIKEYPKVTHQREKWFWTKNGI